MTSPTKKPRIVKVPIVFDSEIELEYLQAQHAVEEATGNLLTTAADRIRVARAGARPEQEFAAAEAVAAGDAAEIDALKAVAAEKKAALDAVTVWYTFRALGRKTWSDLVKKYPATAEDQEQFEAEGGQGKAPFDELGIARELLPLSCVSPIITPEKAIEIVDGDDWNATEVATLWAGARYVQIQGSQA